MQNVTKRNRKTNKENRGQDLGRTRGGNKESKVHGDNWKSFKC